MRKSVVTILMCFIISFVGYAQQNITADNFSTRFEKQLGCKSNPKAGKLLIALRKNKFISNTYVVSDTISYFKLHKSLKVWDFKPIAVFGFEEGYPKFFKRSPGTLPPEMIGIVVSDSLKTVKSKLKKLGIDGLEVEESSFDLKGNINKSKKKHTEISCWAK